MDKKIRLLDCTLRDGCHINGGKFGENVIKNVIEKLVESNVDIIEVGFLWDQAFGTDTSKYLTIADVKRILPKDRGNSKFSLMADFIDLEHLEPYDGTIDFIRLSFKRWRLDWGLKTGKILMDKGYKVFINLVNNNVYTDQQYLEAIQKINELHPYGFCIVDTFGTMRLSELSHRYYLVENNIHPDMTIGLHLHENLGLAYSLAQHLTEIASPKRDIVIDGSLLGMGRVPGNLCIEQIMDYMNSQYGTNYALEPVYDAIDDYIAPIKAVNPWGFSIPYALSAKYNLHRTYAEYLAGKNRLKTKDIQRILSQIPQSEAETYNESYVEKLYLDYMNVSYDDRNDIAQLKTDLMGKDVMVIAPGASVKSASQKIKDAISDNTIIISVNFNPETFATSDIVFLTNTKRYDMIKHRSTRNKLMVTSNLIRDVENRDYTIAYNEISHFGDEYCDDSTLMLISVLQKCGVKEVKLCGFDGSKNGDRLTFCDGLLDRNAQKNDSKMIQAILDSALSGIKKTFITESVYR